MTGGELWSSVMTPLKYSAQKSMEFGRDGMERLRSRSKLRVSSQEPLKRGPVCKAERNQAPPRCFATPRQQQLGHLAVNSKPALRRRHTPLPVSTRSPLSWAGGE